jgi:hypothetical protein
MCHWSRRPGLSGALGSSLAVVLGVALALALPACTKSTSTNPTPVTPTPSPPLQSIVSIALLNIQLVNPDHPPFNWQLIYTLHVVESGGVGCNLNYVHLDVFKADGTFLERTAVGTEVFVGGNRLEARATRDFTVINGFNSDPLSGRYLVVTLGFTDDKANVGTTVSGHLVIG